MSVGTPLAVHKLHGARNVFGLIDERPAAVADYAALARRICRNDGPLEGADGLLVIGDDRDAFARMRIFNADGSEAEMCGNGVRCVALYLAERGAPARFVLATGAGPIGVEIVAREPFEARVDMGPVGFPGDALEETAAAPGGPRHFIDVNVGNPHAVLFVDAVDAIDLATLGVAFNALERFPHGTNVHLAQVVDEAMLLVRHYERGVGLTQACGTGAVACAAAAIATRGLRSPVTVLVPGGTLRVEWAAGESAYLTGPAVAMGERAIPA